MRPLQTLIESADADDIACAAHDRGRVQPDNESFRDAIAFAEQSDCDAIVAVDGGSTIDTAKAVNLYTCHPPEDFTLSLKLVLVNALVVSDRPLTGRRLSRSKRHR
jgi:hydroxyacid-oxoacid transhydrogenase